MSQKWVALFDCKGVDVLIPCDSMMTEEVMEWMSGKKFKSALGLHVGMAIVRARANPQRFPEVWVYDTKEDLTEEVMRKMWDETPQVLADLVRGMGKCLFKTPREVSVIV